MVRESKGNNMSKKLTLAVIFTGVVAYLAYRRFYYIGKAEALKDELERKIAEKIQENVHS